MANNWTTKEKWLLTVLIVFAGVLGGLLVYFLTAGTFGRTSSSVIEKVTEKQVYLESSATISAVDLFTASLVNIFPREDLEKYASADPLMKKNCFEKVELCQNVAVILTNDGLVLYGGDGQEKKAADLMAVDSEGVFYDLEKTGDLNGFTLYRLVKQGELSLDQNKRTKLYNLKAVVLDDSKSTVVGQQAMVLVSMVLNNPQVEEGIVTGRLLMGDQQVDLGESLKAVEINFSAGIKGDNRLYFNLDGHLMAMNNKNGSQLLADDIDALLKRVSVNDKQLKVVDLGLHCLVIDGDMAKKLGLELDYGCLVADSIDSQGQVQTGGVTKGSLAEQAGFRPGDTVIEMDGQSLLNLDLIEEVMGKASGEKLHFTVLRNGKALDLTVNS